MCWLGLCIQLGRLYLPLELQDNRGRGGEVTGEEDGAVEVEMILSILHLHIQGRDMGRFSKMVGDLDFGLELQLVRLEDTWLERETTDSKKHKGAIHGSEVIMEAVIGEVLHPDEIALAQAPLQDTRALGLDRQQGDRSLQL